MPRELLDPLLEGTNPVADPSAADLHDGLAGAASADSARQAREPSVLLGEPRQRVAQLGKLDLQLAIAATGPLREDVDDQLCAVDCLQPCRVLERPRLGRPEIDVEDRHAGASAHAFEDELLELAASHDRLGVDLGPPLAQRPRDDHARRTNQLQGLGEVLVVGPNPHDQRPFGAVAAGRAADDPGELVFERLDRRLEIEVELVDGSGANPDKRILGRLVVVAGRQDRRVEVGGLDAPGQPAVANLHHRHEVEPQQCQVVEIVEAEGLSLEMSVHESKAAEAPGSTAQTTDVGKHEPARVADDDVADRSVASDQNAHLAAELFGDLGEMTGELGGDDFVRRHTAPVRSLESALLRGLDALDVAVDGMLGDEYLPRCL